MWTVRVWQSEYTCVIHTPSRYRPFLSPREFPQVPSPSILGQRQPVIFSPQQILVLPFLEFQTSRIIQCAFFAWFIYFWIGSIFNGLKLKRYKRAGSQISFPGCPLTTQSSSMGATNVISFIWVHPTAVTSRGLYKVLWELRFEGYPKNLWQPS